MSHDDLYCVDCYNDPVKRQVKENIHSVIYLCTDPGTKLRYIP